MPSSWRRYSEVIALQSAGSVAASVAESGNMGLVFETTWILACALLAFGLNAAAQERPAFVGEKACTTCHAVINEHFSHTTHAKTFRQNPRDEREGRVCEACHGPGSLHVKNPAD